MASFLRGALVEYSGDFLGPIPNIVVFQFNPEQLARTITIPPRHEEPTGGTQQQERHATSAPPVESFTITAHFSAADDLGQGGASSIPRLFGVGPQLAALEKMVYPPQTPGGLIGLAIDAIGSALSHATEQPATRQVPRVHVPKVLFIWGAVRILPVSIKSLTITEKKFDFQLNPVEAEVTIGLNVAGEPPDDDGVAKGALKFTNLIKDTQATANLAKGVELTLDIIPF